MRRKTFPIALIAAVLYGGVPVSGVASAQAGCASSEAGGGDWFTRSGDLTGRRYQPAEDLIGPAEAATLTAAWSAPAGGISGTPIVVAGCVYFSDGGAVHKLNADTGELVWTSGDIRAGASLTYDAGRIFANVANDPGVGMSALNEADGTVAWTTHLDEQYGVSVTGSPVAFKGMVLTGIAAGIQEIENGEQRTVMRGAYAFLDQATGRILHKGYTIPDEDFAAGYAGGGLWSTPAVDIGTGYAYFGTGNPYSAREHANTNAIIKVDADASRPTFGQIVDSYKGITDLYLANATYKPACEETNLIVPCEPLDVDFGGSPNLWTDDRGRTFVGDLQKAGVYHAVDADTMSGVWTATISYPAMFGNAGTAAVDGDRVYATVEFGTMFGVNAADGGIGWAFPTGGNGWATVNSVANGVVYEADNGLLRALDAATGVPVLIRPLAADTGSSSAAGLDAGVAIARHTLYVNASDALVAYRPAQ
jgi:outer membrane protein assembly factor BamB